MFERFNEIREAQALGNEAGFTLIELLIVIVVLAILAAVVIFGLSGLSGQSAQSACKSDAKTVEIAVEAYHAQKGVWPDAATNPLGTTATDGNIELTTSTNGIRYLRTYPTNTKHYAITIGAQPAAATAGKVYVTAYNGDGVTANQTNIDFDNTAQLTGNVPGGTTTSANPCDYVQ